ERTTCILPSASPASPTFAISKATSELLASCESWKGNRRIVTTLDAGRTCKAPTLKAGVSCTEATSKEKVSSTVVCMVPGGGCGFGTGGAGALVIGASGVWIVSGIFAGVAICDDTDSGTYEETSWTASVVEGSIPLARTCGIACSCANGSVIAVAAARSIEGVAATSATTADALGSSVGGGTSGIACSCASGSVIAVAAARSIEGVAATSATAGISIGFSVGGGMYATGWPWSIAANWGSWAGSTTGVTIVSATARV